MDVLLGIGPGDPGREALEKTLSRAQETGDRVTVAVYGEPEERDDLAALARKALSDSAVEGTVRHIESDSPGSALVDISENEAFDRLAIPGGHRSPLGKIQFDDMTEFILLNAPISVILVR